MINPPGSTSEQLPDDVLSLLPDMAYLSTACETGHLLGMAILKNPDREDLPEWQNKMHRRCRLNHKFLGERCFCNCHKSEKRGDENAGDPQKAGLGTDGSQT